MVQTDNSKKTSVIGIVIASVCILVYIGALVSVLIRGSRSMEQQRQESYYEFEKLVDLVKSLEDLSFEDESFEYIINKFLHESNTLEGIIFSGPYFEYGFERERGKVLTWVNNSPRFKDGRFDLSREKLFERLIGLRNINIQAVAGKFNYDDLAIILRQAILVIAASLAVAFFTLMLESLQKRGTRVPRAPAAKEARPDRDAAKSQPAASAGGKYSQRGHVVRQENTEARLTEELRRCAAGGHDLAFIIMEYKSTADESFYPRFAADAARFFSSRDFVCEKDEKGISVICPALNLDTGFLNADEFHNRILNKYPSIFKSKTDLCMGISARSQRPVNA
ncbi:MAG: hypothetical protein FWG46_06750, partial [Treponema sp.]|nr:hypothetical protein [Treponema sp.]